MAGKKQGKSLCMGNLNLCAGELNLASGQWSQTAPKRSVEKAWKKE